MSDRRSTTTNPFEKDLVRAEHARGQTLVEFALVLPMLLVLLLGVADFGRVFQAGIVTEAAARNGAEAAALERLRLGPPTVPGDAAFYANLHRIAAQAACAEARSLPSTTYVPDNAATPAVDEESCPTMPVIAVCVRDGGDPGCGQTAPGYTGTVPAECTEMSTGWSSASGGLVGSHSVEVRLCYRFTTLFNLDLSLPLGWGISIGDVYLQRTRTFVIDCPPGDPTSC
jgi:Flp pilus assembly protein TadG